MIEEVDKLQKYQKHVLYSDSKTLDKIRTIKTYQLKTKCMICYDYFIIKTYTKWTIENSKSISLILTMWKRQLYNSNIIVNIPYFWLYLHKYICIFCIVKI